MVILTYRYRVKTKGRLLAKWSRSVNFVWNYSNETQKKAVSDGRKWLSGFDLNYLTAGSAAELKIHSGTIHATCEQYARSRGKKPWLRFRGRKSLGWVPFKGRDIKTRGLDFVFYGQIFKVFYSRKLPDGFRIRDGSNFSQDSKGNWYLNLVLEIPDAETRCGSAAVGIDLGLTDLATLSNGEKIEAKQFFRKQENRLAQAQRGRKKRLVKRIHAKIANKRKDFLHKLSTRIVREFTHVYVGDVSACGLSKTNLAKSVHDAGWSTFRAMLAYKSIREGATFSEVDERLSSQICSNCGALPNSRPRGIADLGIREWTCDGCGVVHSRDVNAARNILRLGHQTPAQGICAI